MSQPKTQTGYPLQTIFTLSTFDEKGTVHTTLAWCTTWPEGCVSIGVFSENLAQCLVIISEVGSNAHLGP